MKNAFIKRSIKRRKKKFGRSRVAQCNFRIFLSLSFYVKSILEDLEVVKRLLFATLGVMDFVDFQNISLYKMQKFRASKCVKVVECGKILQNAITI